MKCWHRMLPQQVSTRDRHMISEKCRGLVRISSECHQGMDVMKIVATSEGGLGPHPPSPPFPSPNCEVAALPRGDPEQLLCNLGKGRGRGGEDGFVA